MPPITPEQLAEASTRLDKLTQKLEKTILDDICRRIAKAGTITDTAEWQMMRLKEMGYANEVIEKAIADYTKMSEAEIRQLFFEAGQVSDDFYEEVYSKAGMPFVPLEDNPYMQQFLSAGIEQTNNELVNFTQSMGFAVRQPDGTLAFQGVAKTYQSALDLAQMQVATGVFDYTTAIRNATKSLTDSGLQFVDYASGHRNRADVATRRAVLTGISQMTGKIAEHNMDELGTEYVEVTAHAGARPDHAVWQGKIYRWKRGNMVDKSADGGIINTGAVSGALNSYSKEAERHAVQYYEAVRHMKTDTKKISVATGIRQDKIDKIKNHIFVSEHELLSGIKRFDPSYDMAQSWQRLISGNFKEQDIVLLKHEYAELRYMEKGYSQNEAHLLASKKYDYAKYCE